MDMKLNRKNKIEWNGMGRIVNDDIRVEKCCIKSAGKEKMRHGHFGMLKLHRNYKFMLHNF